MSVTFRPEFVQQILISYSRQFSYFSFVKNPYLCLVEFKMERYLVISRGTEMLRVPASRLVYVSADGNYANVVTQDNRRQMVSFQLGQVEDMIGDQLGEEGGKFVRLGRSLIINTDFVYWVDIAKQQLILSDCVQCYHELTASREVLIKLKAYIDVMTSHG
jgi:DNA-binding LytR/AlgR family response regulator